MTVMNFSVLNEDETEVIPFGNIVRRVCKVHQLWVYEHLDEDLQGLFGCPQCSNEQNETDWRTKYKIKVLGHGIPIGKGWTMGVCQARYQKEQLKDQKKEFQEMLETDLDVFGGVK